MMGFRTLPGGGLRRAVCIALAAGAIGSVVLPGVRLWQETAAHEWRLLGLGMLTRARLWAGADEYALQRYEWIAGEAASLPLAVIAADPKIDWTRELILGIAVDAGWRGLSAGGAAALAALALIAGRRLYIYGGGAEIPPVTGGSWGARSGGQSAAGTGKAARPPPSAGPAKAGRGDGDRSAAGTAPRRKRRRAGRWI